MAKPKPTKANFPKSVPIPQKGVHSSDSSKVKPKHNTINGKFNPPGWRGVVGRDK
jgi:hypothetical protein